LFSCNDARNDCFQHSRRLNNDIHGHALDDARTLKSMVGQVSR